MKIHHTVCLSLALLLLSGSCMADSAWAAPNRRNHEREMHQGDTRRHPSNWRDWRREQGRQPSNFREKGWVLDQRHNHNRYYPPPGHAVRVLPPGHRLIPYQGLRYFYFDGVWYRSSGSRFIVTIPPPGLMVPFLPPFYTTIRLGNVPYYYADGIYYTWQPRQRLYAVTAPPPAQEAMVTETPEQLFTYPKEGQSEAQQALDRYECHQWSKGETGFDPTLPTGNVRPEDYAGKRADYLRAMGACLEARDYSVK